MTPNQLPPLPPPDRTMHQYGKKIDHFTSDQMHAYALAAFAQQAQPAVPEWLNSAFPNCEDLQALGLKAPTPVQFAQQLYKRWKAKLEKVEEELCALKAIHARQPAVPVDEQMTPSFAQLKQILDSLDRCHHRDSKAEFLRTWIRDWAENKVSRAILAMRPAVEPMTLEQREVLAALVVGACEHRTRTLLALRAIEATEAQYGIGITAKAEDANQPTKEADKP